MITELHENSPGNHPEPIAIVGVGCRLSGNVSSLTDLLAALREGRDCVTEIPPERWNVDAFYDPDPITPGKSYVRHGGFVADVDRFDAAFFGISDAEAARMDPQQRLVLETVWHALEDAGQSPDELAKSNTGVFLAMVNTSAYTHFKAIYEGIEGITGYDTMADAMSIAAGRISHFLDLQGPCFALDTACSGSMVALHQARQSILVGDCDAAIVAGVNLILHPGVHVAFSKVGLMSRSGRCRAFDESADGYIRSEGCVAVLLRRQSAAIARNDRVLANIIGAALTQDGRTPAVTAPNGQMQEKVIRLALARAGISPNEIGYVEAHGTGTPIGDPIEMGALVNVYGPGRSDQQSLFVGSAKSNFGHIESAAGLLGVVKAALSLDQELIFPSLHFKQLNPNIDLRQAPVQVPTATAPWPRGERPRMAGVNSFGFSGTNAHTILQESSLRDETASAAQARPCELIVLSAKSPPSLQELAEKWTDVLDADGGPVLADMAFTAAIGRSHMRHRLAVVARSKDELSEKLHSWREGRMSRGVFAGQIAIGRRPKIAFVFTGQGAQYAGMGRQLYQLEPRFKAAIDRCAALMDSELGAPLPEVLFGAESGRFLDDTRYVQPALFAIEYALADLLHHWGIEPNYVIGHSVGEIVAACVAGVINVEGAVRFVMARGRLMGQLPRNGKMLAIDATPELAREWLAGKEAEVSIAGVNGPHSVVVSGAAAAIDGVAERATAAGHRSTQLEVSHAFHSPLMEPILPELEHAAASLRIAAGNVPVLSNVTGDVLSAAVPAAYWSSHVRQPVLFYQGMSKIIEAGCSLLVEIGPHPALTPAIAAAFDMKKARCITTLMRDQLDGSHILETLANLYVSGTPVNFDRAFWNPDYQRAALPLYPFRGDKHWLREELRFTGTGRRSSPPAVETDAVVQELPMRSNTLSVDVAAARRFIENHLDKRQVNKIQHSFPSPRYWTETDVPVHEVLESRQKLRLTGRGSVVNLYMGVPYCIKTNPGKCGYCLFPVEDFVGYDALEDYFGYLKREAAMYKDAMQGQTLGTVYFGGGTSNLYKEPMYPRLMELVRALFPVIAPEVDITLEGIPQLFTREKLQAIKDAGMNRISVGVQQINERLNGLSGRKQTTKHVVQTLEWAREFSLACNVDLIFGWPQQTVSTMVQDLETVISWGVHDITHYELNVGGPTDFALNRYHELPSTLANLEMYRVSRDLLMSHGYQQITAYNWRKPGDPVGRRYEEGVTRRFDSMDTLGLGYAAITFFGDVALEPRQSWSYINWRKLAEYKAAIDGGRFPVECGFRHERDDFKISMVFRNLFGLELDRSDFRAAFGVDVYEDFSGVWDALAEWDFIKITPEKIALTGDGPFYTPMIQTLLAEERYRQLRNLVVRQKDESGRSHAGFPLNSFEGLQDGHRTPA